MISATEPNRHRFYFCLAQGFSLFSYSCTVDILRAASLIQSDVVFETRVVSNAGDIIVAGNGTKVLPDIQVDEMRAPGTFVVIAGTGANRQDLTAEKSAVRKAWAFGLEIWGVSSGVIPLAQSGLLQGRVIAAHWDDAPFLRTHFPKIQISDNIYETGPKLSTCAGGAAAADLALSRVRQLLGPEAARGVLTLLNIEGHREGRTGQRGYAAQLFPSENAHVATAVQLMKRSIRRRVTIADIAATLGLSQKHMERLFRSEFGVTPKTVYERLRLEDARREVLVGRLPISQIAHEYEFTSSIFASKYRAQFGVNPLHDRQLSSMIR
ncbi:GlxA family transcriptional regulator [Phaeobacter sp. 22II1-1F12B]|uniref:GlxA family transcriptional regulator n=1 Tax=Phaeobacter sp. 22II1-1F12B TaxID=1317111 RepID=UPI000B5209E8|nr:helix-turn-helix domain-containing protein [Phaeobacter sp. 22II1-1F12B]OWU69052.1 hypothetical protein ATO1_24910 [Phaeobacter sp. 22II1-1F12B]